MCVCTPGNIISAVASSSKTNITFNSISNKETTTTTSYLGWKKHFESSTILYTRRIAETKYCFEVILR